MKKVDTIPNLPGLCVAVRYEVEGVYAFGQKKGQTFLSPVRCVGVSGREVFSELPQDEREESPVVWRFITGCETGGEDSNPWNETRIEIPSMEENASEFITRSQALKGKNFQWFAMLNNDGTYPVSHPRY
jgi:hypothetical protein